MDTRLRRRRCRTASGRAEEPRMTLSVRPTRRSAWRFNGRLLRIPTSLVLCQQGAEPSSVVLSARSTGHPDGRKLTLAHLTRVPAARRHGPPVPAARPTPTPAGAGGRRSANMG